MNTQELNALEGILTQQSSTILKAVDEKITQALGNQNPFIPEVKPVETVKKAPKKAATSAPIPKLLNQPVIEIKDGFIHFSGKIPMSEGPSSVTGGGREKWESKTEKGQTTSCYVTVYIPERV